MFSLGSLLLMFIGMSVISILGILFMFLAKDFTKKKMIFYFLVIWSILIAFFSAKSLPTNFLTQQLITWLIGAIGVLALLVFMKAKVDKQQFIAYILVTSSVVLGLVNLFLF